MLGYAGNKKDYTDAVVNCWKESKINNPVIYVKNGVAFARPETGVHLGFKQIFERLLKDPGPPQPTNVIRWILFCTTEDGKNMATPRLLYLPTQVDCSEES